jgi:hypothetical protein
MIPEQLAYESQEFNSKLEGFILSNRLPMTWFDVGIDHVAIKAYSPDDYDQLIEQLLPITGLISEVRMDERRLAAARLLGDYAMNLEADFGPDSLVEWIEVMEARPEDQSDEPPKLDHAEVYLPRGLIPIRSVLNTKKIPFLDQKNLSHAWVSVVISPEVDELKFADTRLADIVMEDLKNDSSRVIL